MSRVLCRVCRRVGVGVGEPLPHPGSPGPLTSAARFFGTTSGVGSVFIARARSSECVQRVGLASSTSLKRASGAVCIQ